MKKKLLTNLKHHDDVYLLIGCPHQSQQILNFVFPKIKKLKQELKKNSLIKVSICKFCKKRVLNKQNL